MPVFKYERRMERSPEEVFDFMMDFTHAPYWRSLVSKMEVVGGGPARSGCDIEVTFDTMGKQRKIITHVTEVERPRVFAFWNANDGMRGDFRYEVEPSKEGSVVRFTCDARPVELRLWLLLPWIYKQSRRRYATQLEKLESAMDQRLPRGAGKR